MMDSRIFNGWGFNKLFKEEGILSLCHDKISGNERGVSMLEAAIAMPLYMLCILFIPAVIPFMFNMLGAHYASVISMREVSAGSVGQGVSLEQQLYQSLEENFRIFTTGVSLDSVTVGRITVDSGERQVLEAPASCLLDGSCTIPSGGFVTISTSVRFIDMGRIGLPDFTSSTLAIMKMSNFQS
jgi:hypothetical protein